MKKELYDKYKNVIDEKFKQDLLDVCVQVYGEKRRAQFEANMSKIDIHSKFTIEELKKFLEEQGLADELNDPLFEEAFQEYETRKKEVEQEGKEKRIQLQRQVLEEIKSELSPEEALELEKEMQDYEFNGSFNLLDFAWQRTFEGQKNDVLESIADRYKLEDMYSAKKYENELPDIAKRYHSEGNKIDLETRRNVGVIGSSYENMMEELTDVDAQEVDELDLPLEMSIPGAFVTSLKDRESNDKYRDHIFLSLKSDKAQTLGKLAHEILHTLERTEKTNENTGKKEFRTGFNEYSIENENVNFESECMHQVILNSRIYPALRNLGYDIYNTSDYDISNFDTNYKFFDRYESAILDARCEGMEGLYDIVGKENFIELANLQGRRNAKLDPEATKVFENMKEYERQNLAVRIGKFTLPMQEDILGKKQAEAELSGLQKNEKDIGVDNEY